METKIECPNCGRIIKIEDDQYGGMKQHFLKTGEKQEFCCKCGVQNEIPSELFYPEILRDWIETKSKFEFLSYCIREEICGNSITEEDIEYRSNILELHRGNIEELIRTNLLKRKFKYNCPNCEMMMLLTDDSRTNDYILCNRCGEEIDLMHIDFSKLDVRYESRIKKHFKVLIQSISLFEIEMWEVDWRKIPLSAVQNREQKSVVVFYISPYFDFTEPISVLKEFPHIYLLSWHDISEVLFEWKIELRSSVLTMRDKNGILKYCYNVETGEDLRAKQV